VPARFAFLDDAHPAAFAHRGGAAEAPENSVTAFERAVESLGYHYLETDVHATADGEVVVIHDPVLDRVTDRAGEVTSLPWSEVGAARLSDGSQVPRLAEVLAAWPGVRWNIDAKHDRVVEPLARVVAAAGAVERVCITAFSDRRVHRVRRLLGPRLCTAMGPIAVAGLRAASFAPSLAPDALWRPAGAAQVPVSQGPVPVVDRRFLSAAHRYGLAVHVWTIDDESAMRNLLDLGVDGIMTDRPSLLREVLVERGDWGGS
jgi:glycerophosphoryl diester phosphodiesterase